MASSSSGPQYTAHTCRATATPGEWTHIACFWVLQLHVTVLVY